MRPLRSTVSTSIPSASTLCPRFECAVMRQWAAIAAHDGSALTISISTARAPAHIPPAKYSAIAVRPRWIGLPTGSSISLSSAKTLADPRRIKRCQRIEVVVESPPCRFVTSHCAHHAMASRVADDVVARGSSRGRCFHRCRTLIGLKSGSVPHRRDYRSSGHETGSWGLSWCPMVGLGSVDRDEGPSGRTQVG